MERLPRVGKTWKPASTIMQLQKMINAFYKDHLEKTTANFPPTDSASYMARPLVSLQLVSLSLVSVLLVSLEMKQKRGYLIKSIKKWARNLLWIYQSKEENEILGNLSSALRSAPTLSYILSPLVVFTLSASPLTNDITTIFRSRFSCSIFFPGERLFID